MSEQTEANKAVVAKKDVVDRVDLLELLLAQSKVREEHARLKSLQAQLQLADNELQQLRARLQATSLRVQAKYDLKNGDDFDSDTGIITRGPITPAMV